MGVDYKRTFYDKYVKRTIDFILSLIAVILLSPVLLLTAIFVAVKLGRLLFSNKNGRDSMKRYLRCTNSEL